MGAERDTWIASLVSEHGDEIRNADPASQLSMKPNPRAWKRWFSEESTVIDVVETFKEGVTRPELHSFVRNSDLSSTGGRRSAFIATLVWGVGSTNRYYGRHKRLLTSAGLDGALKESYSHLREGKTEAAFVSMDPLPGITFRFHTKWLWVVGSALNMQPLPLIFDNRVMNSLRGLKWPEMTRRQSQSSRWSRYIEDSDAVATRLGVTSEHVELWLFERG